MRETRTSGSEGGEANPMASPYPYQIAPERGDSVAEAKCTLGATRGKFVVAFAAATR
jgi:hypothetical protein